MLLLLVEALLALVLLIFIVWWTMFSGRKQGEVPGGDTRETPSGSAPPDHEPPRT